MILTKQQLDDALIAVRSRNHVVAVRARQQVVDHARALEAERDAWKAKAEAARNSALEEVCRGLAKQADELSRQGEDEAPELLNSTHDWVWGLQSQPAERVVTLAEDKRMDCTCLGSCRGEDGLGIGWRCVLGRKP